MNDIKSFQVSYDTIADVLYITVRKEPAASGVEDCHGIVWRYDSNGELIGATVVDFYDEWYSKQVELTQEISRHFHIPAPQAKIIVEKAMPSHSAF